MPSAPTGNWSIQCAKLLGNTLKNEKVTILQAHAGLASVSQALLALRFLSVYYTTFFCFCCCDCLCELRWNLQKVDFATVAHDSDSGLGKLWQKMHERSDLHVLNHRVRFETLLPEDVPMVNVVMSGPPVNSMVDAKGGWGSPDSEPLMHTVSVMIDMERRPSSCFLAFALELTDKYGPYEKPLKELKDYLKKEFRGWCIWADESWTHSHGLPLDRCRRRGPRLLSRSRLR